MKKINTWILFISGILLFSIYLRNFVYCDIFSWLVEIWVLIIFIFAFILTLINKNKIGIYFGLILILLIGINEIFTMEYFKSKKILEAHLKDDLSGFNLILRENMNFELEFQTMFTTEEYLGKYELKQNKIIFKDKHYDNDFIPDTVYIIGDKIILHFEKNGIPETSFSSYFDINYSNIK